jgi:L-ascorbate metabolism protein UlaG (beta-lactamase superfamily)
MQITHLGHACLLVDVAGTRVLVDPGTYSADFETLTDLDAILVTHQHPDHVDPDRLPAVLASNPQARLVVEPETAAGLDDEAKATDTREVKAGDRIELSGAWIEVVGRWHAVNHDRVPPLGNVGYLIGAEGEPTLFHPGDSYDDAPLGVDVLALPLNAPWCRMRETLTFLRMVAPTYAFPIHDGLLNDNGRAAYLMHIDRFGPDHTTLRDLADGSAATFTAAAERPA